MWLMRPTPFPSQHLESYSVKLRQIYAVYLTAGLGAVRDALGISARQIADNMMNAVRPCVRRCCWGLC